MLRLLNRFFSVLGSLHGASACLRVMLDVHGLTSGEISYFLSAFERLHFFYDSLGGFSLLHSGWELDERLLVDIFRALSRLSRPRVFLLV